jgi:hypothetical protein
VAIREWVGAWNDYRYELRELIDAGDRVFVRGWQSGRGKESGVETSAWDEFRIEAEDYRELDDERVLVLTRYSGRGKASGLEVGKVWAKGASLFHVRGGKVTRQVFYLDRDLALADLGLTLEGDSSPA